LIFTMMAAAALAAGLSPGTLSPEPTWLNDYKAAQTRVVAVKKPMAVFVGSGKEGWAKVVREGTLDAELNKALAGKFVCLYVDTDTAAGRTLAGAFDMAGKGLIISDRAGTQQAFSLSGDLTRLELANTLTKYADPDREVHSTETVNREARPASIVASPQPYYPQYQAYPGSYSSGST
jgi:hypothetical protein